MLSPSAAVRLGVAGLTILVTLTGCGELPPAPDAVPGGLSAARVRTDPDLTLFIGPDPAESGIIIYDIQNGFIYDGPASQGNLILNVHDNQILDASNTQAFCRIDDDQLIEASSGTVLFIAEGMAVYEGGNPAGFAFVTFKRDEIHDGRSRRQVLATATEDLTKVSDARRLLLTALLASRCGAPQLPDPQLSFSTSAATALLGPAAALVAIEDVIVRVLPGLASGGSTVALQRGLSQVASQLRTGGGMGLSRVLADTEKALKKYRQQAGLAFHPDVDAVSLALAAVNGLP